jgi:hypothetical protein
MILLVAIAVSAVGWLSYRGLEQALLPAVLDRIETHSKLVAADLQSYVCGARTDAATFSSRAVVHGVVTAHCNGGIDPLNHLSESVWRAGLFARLVAELGAKPAYSQFRLIGVDDGGRELVRVDRSDPNGAVRVVPDAELQRNGDRPYFQETIKLAENEIYVSPIDLNQENGTFQTPYVPTLRVATPIFAPDGKPYGIVVINVDMRPLAQDDFWMNRSPFQGRVSGAGFAASGDQNRSGRFHPPLEGPEGGGSAAQRAGRGDGVSATQVVSVLRRLSHGCAAQGR